MGLIQWLKGFIQSKDSFASHQLLNYKSGQTYQTFWGGLVTILIFGLICAVIYKQIKDVATFQDITSVEKNSNAAYPTPYNLSTYSGGNFMFGVSILGLDLTTGNRYFDIELSSDTANKETGNHSFVKYQLQACSQDHWEQFPQVWDNLILSGVDSWLCPPLDTNFTIKGKYSANTSQQLTITISNCTSAFDSSRGCRSQTQVDQLFQQNGLLIAQLNFINPLLNPGNDNYLSYYLEDNGFIYFSNQIAEDSYLYLEQYQIETDHSLLLFQDKGSEFGGIIRNMGEKNSFKPSNITSYGSFNFLKSGNSIKYQRSYKKYDDFASYIGGLAGSILAICALFSSYNSNAYEINLAKYLFEADLQKNSDESKKQQSGKSNPQTNYGSNKNINPQTQKGKNQQNMETDNAIKDIYKHYNYFHYLKQQLYDFITLLGFKINWTKAQAYNQCKQEMIGQTDVIYILKRLIFLEKALGTILTPNQILGLHLQKKVKLSQAASIRQQLLSRKNIIKAAKQKLSNKRKHQSNSSDENIFPSASNINSQQNLNHNNQSEIYGHLQNIQKDLSQYPMSSDQQDEQPIDKKIIDYKSKIIQLRNQCQNYLKQSQKSTFKSNELSKQIFKGIDPVVLKILNIQQLPEKSQKPYKKNYAL